MSKPKPPPVPSRVHHRNPTVSYRFPPPLLEALQKYAEKQHTGTNAAVVHLLSWALEQAGLAPRDAA